MIYHPFIRLLFGHKSPHSSGQSFSRKHKSLSLESLEDRHMLSISFDPGVVYDYTSENSAVVAPQLGNNYGIFVADFTGDGKNEIMAAKDGYIQTFVNNGGTTAPFNTAPRNFMPDSLGTSQGLAVGNLNGEPTPGDTTPDVVSLVSRRNELSIYFWDGRYVKNDTPPPSKDTVSTFNMFDVLGITGVNSGNFSMYLIDLQVLNANGSGGNDLVCTISYQYNTDAESTLAKGRACVIFQGNGDGTFSNPIAIDISNLPATSTILGVGDLFGDSAMEIIVQNTNNKQIDFYSVSANGTTANKAAFSYTHSTAISSVSVGDVDGNGKQELLIYSKTSDQNHKLDIVKITGSTFTTIDSVTLSTNPSYIAVGDLNNDNKADILISNGSVYQVLLQQDNGKFISQDQIITVADYITSFTGDFDGDGIQDVLVLGKRVATLIPGDASKSEYVVLNFSEMDFTPRDFAVGDFDGNGTLDIAVLGGGQGSDVWIFNGTPNAQDKFVKSKELAITFGEQLLVGQFNTNHAGDDLVVVCGMNDVVGTSNSKIELFSSTSTGLTSTSISSSTLNSGYLGSFAVGKITSEGKDDIVAIKESASGNLVFLLKCGNDGKFTSTAVSSGLNPTAVAIGDMDKDGKNDIVVLLAGQQSVQIIKQGSNNQFTPQTPIFVSNNIQSSSCTTLEVADFDGDGLPDVLVGIVSGTGSHPGSFVVMQNTPTAQQPLTLATSVEIPEFASNTYANLGISLGFVDNNASPDVLIVYNNKAVFYRNQANFTLENGEVTLVFRDYDSTIVNSELSNLNDLNKQKTFLDEWSCFQLEVWANTKSSAGVSEFSCTIEFDSTIFEVESVSGNFVAQAGSAFENFTCVVNGNQVTIAGTLKSTGGTQGDNTNTLLGRIAFIPVANGGLPVNMNNSYIQAYENGFTVDMGTATWLKTVGSSSQGKPTASLHNDVVLFPVVYDVNDDGRISLVDLDYFADAFLATSYANASNDVKEFYYLMDFDHSGRVSLADLDYFVDNYLLGMTVTKCRTEKVSLIYADEFYDWVEDNWVGQTTGRLALPSSIPPSPAALPAIVATSDDNIVELLATNSTASGQNQALISYLNSLNNKRTETSFFDELASNQDDVDSLLKKGAL